MGNLNDPVPKKAPYEDTEVHYTRTKAEIECLLKSYGVKGVRWTTLQGQDDVLEFIAEADIQGVKKGITVQVSPPHIYITKRIKGKGIVNNYENIDQEYRLLFYWIKAKIEAITWGLSTIEQEFLSDITAKLPNGSTVKVGEMIAGAMAKNSLESLPFFDAPQTRPHTNAPVQDRNKIIDVGQP